MFIWGYVYVERVVWGYLFIFFIWFEYMKGYIKGNGFLFYMYLNKRGLN